MSDSPTYTITVIRAADPLPPEAKDLFGSEVETAWVKSSPEPVLIAAQTDGGAIAAGIFMLLETEGGQNKVASIRQLVVPPAHRSRGLAGRLLRRTTEVAAQAGCQRIRSTAGWGCPDHLFMYERLRYTKAPASDRPYLVHRELEKPQEPQEMNAPRSSAQ